MNIVQYLNSRGIKWMPIYVFINDKGKKVITKGRYHRIPSFTELAGMTKAQLKGYQKTHSKHTEWIAIDTTHVAQIDIDDVNGNHTELWSGWRDSAPYYLSATKKLPHIFSNGVVDGMRKSKKELEFLNGQWAWIQKDAIVMNADKQDLAFPDYFQQTKASSSINNKENNLKPISATIQDDYQPNDKQYTQLGKILKELDQHYYDDRDSWRSVGFALRDYANTSKMFDMYVAWSKQSDKFVSESDCAKVWNSKTTNRPIKFGTLIKYHKDSKQTSKIDHYVLDKPKSIDMMEGIDDTGVEVVSLDQEYLTDKDGSLKFIRKLDDMKGKITFVKSKTGSGKTTMLQTLSKHFKNHA
jgi:hypothetical protein